MNETTLKPYTMNKDWQGEKEMPLEDYLAAPGISKHDLDDLKKSPAYYMDKSMGRVVEEKKIHNMVGTCLHALFFERKKLWITRPETYTDSKGKEKAWSGNSTSCQAWLAEHAKETVLTETQAESIEATVELMRNDHHIQQLPTSGRFEKSLFAYDPEFGLLLKTRPDWIADNGTFIDLKTTTNARTDAFGREILKYRYHVQAAMVRRVARLLGMEFNRYIYIAVEKSKPPRINVRELTATAIDLGNFAIEDGLTTLNECKLSGYWPDYSGAGKRIELIDVPSWGYSDAELFKDEPLLIGGKEVSL